MKMGKTAILLGASGLVGNEVLSCLLKDEYFELVKIFVRKKIPIDHPKLYQYIIDFNCIENYSDFIKGDIVFCCLGTTIKMAGSQEAFVKVDYVYPSEFAKIAKQNGAEKFLLISSLGAYYKSANFYLKVKGDIELALEKIKFESLIILRPSMLLGERKEFRFGEIIGKAIMKSIDFLLIGKLKKYKAIKATTVAKAMVLLAKPELAGVNFFESNRLQQLGK